MLLINNDLPISIQKQCNLLSIPRSSYYYKAQSLSNCDVELMNRIRDIWLAYPFFGYRKVTEFLGLNGLKVNYKRVRRLMQRMDLKAIYPGPKTSSKHPDHQIYPYLLRDLTIHGPNHVWQVDITYIKVERGFVYLVALIDVYSRFVVGYDVSISLDADSCLIALEMALTRAMPKIINSDQGSQFTSTAWIKALKKAKISISMDGKGRAIDNIYIERFWRSIKYEDLYLKCPATIQEARQCIDAYIVFYNDQRPHQSLDYKTPAMLYFQSTEAAAPADQQIKQALEAIVG